METSESGKLQKAEDSVSVSPPVGEQPLWNPYAAGVALGPVLLTTYLVMGFGLGASNALLRFGIFALDFVIPKTLEHSAYFSHFVGPGKNVLNEWLVYLALGVFMGGMVSAYASGRLRRAVQRGAGVSLRTRFTLAFIGGILMGLGARFGHGCTSGQALTGGGELAVGSWAFMMMVFVGGYAMAPVVRRFWQ